ncbi:hypothetical protein V8E52_011196, partial [Russula decolorans]
MALHADMTHMSIEVIKGTVAFVQPRERTSGPWEALHADLLAAEHERDRLVSTLGESDKKRQGAKARCAEAEVIVSKLRTDLTAAMDHLDRQTLSIVRKQRRESFCGLWLTRVALDFVVPLRSRAGRSRIALLPSPPRAYGMLPVSPNLNPLGPNSHTKPDFIGSEIRRGCQLVLTGTRSRHAFGSALLLSCLFARSLRLSNIIEAQPCQI